MGFFKELQIETGQDSLPEAQVEVDRVHPDQMSLFALGELRPAEAGFEGHRGSALQGLRSFEECLVRHRRLPFAV